MRSIQIHYEIDKKATGNRLQRERLRFGYTQERLSEAMGVTSKYLSKIETGAAAPSLPFIVKFSEVTGRDLNFLLLGRYQSGDGHEGVAKDTSFFDLPNEKLSKKNRRIINETAKKLAEILEEFNS